MATKTQIGGEGALFVGEDKRLRLTSVVDGEGDLVDMAGWTVQFVARKTYASTAVLDLAATITGTFDSDPSTNTQEAYVDVTDTLSGALTAGTYHYSWKRMDADEETILSYGALVVERATQV